MLFIALHTWLRDQHHQHCPLLTTGTQQNENGSLWSGFPKWYSVWELLARPMLLHHEERNGRQDGEAGKKTHQDPVLVQDIGVGFVANCHSDAQSDGSSDDLERRAQYVEQVVELRGRDEPDS